MKLLFIDETQGSINPKIFGISVISIDISKYDKLKTEFEKCLKKHNWDPKVEFKGRYLFSNKPGNQNKTPADMIAITKEIISWLTSEKNQRAGIFFTYNENGKNLENYFELVKKAIGKLPKTTNKQNGKHLITVYLDSFQEAEKKAVVSVLNKFASDALLKRGYILIEGTITQVFSNNSSIGIIYADILAYLAKWIIENPTVPQLNIEDLIQHTTAQKINIAHEMIETKKIKITKI